MKGEYGYGGTFSIYDSSYDFNLAWWKILTNGNNFDNILCKEISYGNMEHM